MRTGRGSSRPLVVWLAFSLMFMALLATAELASSRPPLSDACRTAFGVCRVRPAPLGYPCNCYGDPGRVIPPPRNELSDLCRTRYGVCRIPPSPVGAPCHCYRDPGRVIPR